jgi:hypothetical protein
MDRDHMLELVESSDLAGLIRFVDGLVEHRQWSELELLRDRCLEAVERGKQLWGVAQFVEYQLALEAPAAHAADVVREGAGRFALGPLWEVAASTHPWSELRPLVEQTRLRTLIGYERSLRGDHVAAEEIDQGVLEIPVELQPWEPAYAVASYRPDKADFPEPPLTDLEWTDLGEPPVLSDETDPCDALLELVTPWADQSNGRVETRAVEGTAVEAIRALGPHRVRLAEVALPEALAIMTWVGASGGAYGRRRGTPVGRSLAWWALAVAAGMDDDWPADPGALGHEAGVLRWIRWDPGDQVGGWQFHLAVEDPEAGLAWAISAADAR